MNTRRRLLYFLLLLGLCAQHHAGAQGTDCMLKDPVVLIDFGSGPAVPDLNRTEPENYGRISGYCPTDGHYSYTPATYDCFAGDWFTIAQDHTPGDTQGNMMLVNASPYGGLFLQRSITGLTGGSRYELALWMINVCRLHICCSSLSPNVLLLLTTPSGKTLARFRIGDLSQRTSAQWRKFAAFFVLPANENAALLTLYNTTTGGCGNDFALDDISFRECVPPPVKKAVVPPPKKQQPVTTTRPKAPAQKTTAPPTATRIGAPVTTSQTPAPVRSLPQSVPTPLALRTRSNPLLRQIETGTGELQIDLYDNGQIDGDTVSVYHNNALVVSNARLSTAPIRLRIRIDANQPYHELVMVAQNLGTIPPNTSVMMVTAGEEKYRVDISASAQTNAKVVFVWKER